VTANMRVLILAALIAMQSADAFGVAPPVLRPAGNTCCVCSAQCLAYGLQRAFSTKEALPCGSPCRRGFTAHNPMGPDTAACHCSNARTHACTH